MPCSQTRPLTLNQIEHLLASDAPALCQAIREVCVDQEPETPISYLADYEYADLLVKDGKFVSPCGTYPSCAECRELIQRTSYSTIPLALIRNNAVEVFAGETRATKHGKTVPLRILEPGELFGVFETIDYLLGTTQLPAQYSLSAGARSVWVIAPLGDCRLPRALGEVAGTDVDWDKSDSHWSLVKKSTVKASQWKVSAVVFTEAFVSLLKQKDGSDSTFRQMILETGWKQSSSLRHSAAKNAQLRAWFLDGPAKTIPMPFGELYQFATICHLLSIAEGDFPAFQPVGISKQELGPFEPFERFLDAASATIRSRVTNSPRYYPVIMQPGHLSKHHPSGYYSFRCPTLLGAEPPNVANYAETPGPISKTIQDLCEARTGFAIDVQKTVFYSQAGRFDINRPDSRFPWKELYKHVKNGSQVTKESLYTDSPFMVAGVRLART